MVDVVTVKAINRIAVALGATLSIDLRWQGAELDRLIDRAHAALQEVVANRLARAGWQVWAEVAFNHYGDRGSCDLVGWQPATATLLVVEVKSRIGDVQETLRRLDTKTRLGGELARQLGLGRPSAIMRALVVAEGHGSRSVVARHPMLFGGFPVRGRHALCWLRAPRTGGDVKGLLWFEKSSNAHDRVTNPAKRVRPASKVALRSH